RGRFQHGLQLAGFGQLENDVAATDQLTLDPQLREGGPVGVLGQLGADIRILQDVHVGEFLATAHQRLYRTGGEAALRSIRSTLHVDQDGVAGNLVYDGVDSTAHANPLRRLGPE